MPTLHSRLSSRSPLYQKWHEHPYHRHHHWLAAGLAFLIGAYAIAGAWQVSVNELDQLTVSLEIPRAQAQSIPAGFVRRQAAGLVDGAGRAINLRGTNWTGY